MADRNRTDPSITTLPDERLRSRRRKIDSVDSDADIAQDPDPSDEDLLKLARKRYLTSSEAEAKLRLEMLEDQRFRANQQWPDQILTDRTLDKRPTLTINRLPQFIKQITNPQRQARPALQINPVGEGADVDTAEVIQGIIRHIEHSSHAEVAIDQAFEDAVTMGRGWFRVLTEYVDNDGMSFEQDIIVKRIANPFTVYVDPAASELDYSDARYFFVIEDVPEDEFVATYGKEHSKSLELFQSIGDKAPDWFPEGKVRVAEYWYVDEKKVKIGLLPSPEPNHPDLAVPWDQIPAGRRKEIKQTRQVTRRTVHWVKMTAGHVLSRQVWPGKWIPIIPVLGDEINIDGKKDLVGVVRYARDPQRMYNYWVSAQTETIALAPRAPFIGASGQFKGHEDQWKLANTRNFAYLEYEAVDSLGKPMPPPQRQVFEPPIKAIVEATRQADNDLKAVIGFYDPSLGKPSSAEESGRAVLARQKQGETANINFLDNLGRALWHYGRICLDLIPKIYDTPRVLYIMGLDDQRKQITINQPFEDPADAVQKVFNVRTGRYGITLAIGPTWQSRRQEAVASMLQLIQAAPQLMPYIGDLMVAEMDWPGARQISQRLKKLLPPPLQEDPKGPPPLPPQVQAQMQQMGQQIDLLSRALHDAVETVKTKKLELASKEYIAAMQTRAAMAIAMEKVNAEMAQARLEQEIGSVTALMQANHDRITDELSDIRQHALGMDQMQAQGQQDMQQTQATGQQDLQQMTAQGEQDAAMAAMEHGHELEQAAQAHEHAMAQGAQQAKFGLVQGLTDHAGALQQGEQEHTQALEQGAQQGNIALAQGEQKLAQAQAQARQKHMHAMAQQNQKHGQATRLEQQKHGQKLAETDQGHKHSLAEQKQAQRAAADQTVLQAALQPKEKPTPKKKK